jgi:predicted solute-binding protein
LSSNWQNDLTFGIQRIQEKLENSLTRVGNNPEAKKTEAMDATRKARENISRFVETYNHEYPGAAEAEWSRAGSP